MCEKHWSKGVDLNLLSHRLILKSHGTYEHSCENTHGGLHKLFHIQFQGSPEHQSIDGEEVLSKTSGHSVRRAAECHPEELGKDSYRRQSLN